MQTPILLECVGSEKQKVMSQEIHIGQLIKAELRRQGRTNKWLAEQIACNPRTISKIFQKRVIDTQQLLLISKALDFDFFQHYSDLLQ